ALEQEIQGSIDYINSLMPAGKRVQVFQWSGDAEPFESAVAATRTAGVTNLNGGAPLFNQTYLSHSWVSPLGLQQGNEVQVYAANGGEESFGDQDNGRF